MLSTSSSSLLPPSWWPMQSTSQPSLVATTKLTSARTLLPIPSLRILSCRCYSRGESEGISRTRSYESGLVKYSLIHAMLGSRSSTGAIVWGNETVPCQAQSCPQHSGQNLLYPEHQLQRHAGVCTGGAGWGVYRCRGPMWSRLYLPFPGHILQTGKQSNDFPLTLILNFVGVLAHQAAGHEWVGGGGQRHLHLPLQLRLPRQEVIWFYLKDWLIDYETWLYQKNILYFYLNMLWLSFNVQLVACWILLWFD